MEPEMNWKSQIYFCKEEIFILTAWSRIGIVLFKPDFYQLTTEDKFRKIGYQDN